MTVRSHPTDLVTVVGGGLAGCEAAWQLANSGVRVCLFEMRPNVNTGAHQTDKLSELVCSNSLKSDSLDRPAGLLKEEMRRLDSLIVGCADRAAIPGGSALTVDRNAFSDFITSSVSDHPNITVVREEVCAIPELGPVVIATGPLTSDLLSQSISEMLNGEFLYFFDSISPIVDALTIDWDEVFIANRYDKGGEAAYVNCPMNELEYDQLWDALKTGDRVPIHEVDSKVPYFEGCLPIEVMADRGRMTMAFGPLKPVGLTDQRTGNKPFAVVQLRSENRDRSMFNLVGFQTRLKFPEQQRIFRLIPGLVDAEFLRYGQIHRNTFLNSPRCLLPTCQHRDRADLFFAGQLVGVEGYIESAAVGLIAGLNAARRINGEPLLTLPSETAHGALTNYISTASSDNFQPMNINFGIFPPLGERVRKRELRNRLLIERALENLDDFISAQGLRRGAGKK